MERKIIIGGCIAKGIPALKQECPCWKASMDYLLNMSNKPPMPPSPDELPLPPWETGAAATVSYTHLTLPTMAVV